MPNAPCIVWPAFPEKLEFADDYRFKQFNGKNGMSIHRYNASILYAVMI